MTTLHDRLSDLADEASSDPLPGDLWATGRRLHRRHRAGHRARRRDRGRSPGRYRRAELVEVARRRRTGVRGGATRLPDRFYWPTGPAHNGTDTGPIGPLSALLSGDPEAGRHLRHGRVRVPRPAGLEPGRPVRCTRGEPGAVRGRYPGRLLELRQVDGRPGGPRRRPLHGSQRLRHRHGRGRHLPGRDGARAHACGSRLGGRRRVVPDLAVRRSPEPTARPAPPWSRRSCGIQRTTA